MNVTCTDACSPAFTTTEAGDATEPEAIPFAICPAGEERSLAVGYHYVLDHHVEADLVIGMFTIVRVWVVLCPGLQRTMTMAGESAMDARGTRSSAARGVGRAIDHSAAHEIKANR